MTKKIILGMAGIAAIAIVTASAVNVNRTSKMSDLMINLEALSQNEDNNPCSNDNGYDSFSGDYGGAYDCCWVWRELIPIEGKYCMREIR